MMHHHHHHHQMDSTVVMAEGSLGQINPHLVSNVGLSPSSTSPAVSLKQREEIAHTAFKTWFRLRPGHKEIKDHWWALYYRKILPKYHLRDNHLGRKINSWIEEDLRFYAEQNGMDINSLLPKSYQDDHHSVDDEPSRKKKKPMSAKEGTLPAYLHVELVHPPKIDSGHRSSRVHKLASFVHNGDVDWSNESLEEDVLWFKEHRQKLMDAIPTINTRARRNSNVSTKKPETEMLMTSITSSAPSQSSYSRRNKEDSTSAQNPNNHHNQQHQHQQHQHVSGLDDIHDGLEVQQPYYMCNVSWIRCDLLKSEEAYWLKVDLPGMYPGQDFTIHTDDINKLIVKGQRRLDPDWQDASESYLQSRHYGPFYIEMMLPLAVDLGKTEQIFQNGVLTIKCPTKENQWRNISEDIVSDHF